MSKGKYLAPLSAGDSRSRGLLAAPYLTDFGTLLICALGMQVELNIESQDFQ